MKKETTEEMIARFEIERAEQYGGLIRKYKKPTVNSVAKLTGVKDTDLYLLNSLDNESLINVCLSNHELMNLCSQDVNLGNRLLGLGVDINRYIEQSNSINTKIFDLSQRGSYKMQRVLDFKTQIYEEDFLGRKFFKQTGNQLAPAKIRITQICPINNDIGLCFIDNNKQYIITDEDIMYSQGTQGFSFFNAYYVA